MRNPQRSYMDLNTFIIQILHPRTANGSCFYSRTSCFAYRIVKSATTAYGDVISNSAASVIACVVESYVSGSCHS